MPFFFCYSCRPIERIKTILILHKIQRCIIRHFFRRNRRRKHIINGYFDIILIVAGNADCYNLVILFWRNHIFCIVDSTINSIFTHSFFIHTYVGFIFCDMMFYTQLILNNYRDTVFFNVKIRFSKTGFILCFCRTFQSFFHIVRHSRFFIEVNKFFKS